MHPCRKCEHLIRVPSFRKRFEGKIRRGGGTGCWIWTGSLVKGYGQFKINGSVCKPHRLSYVLYVGEIPEGMLVLHNCPKGDNPSCVNPRHLRLGTYKQNMDDMKNKGRDRRTGPKFKIGELHKDAKLSNRDVLRIRSLRHNGGFKSRVLAGMFGVHVVTINSILRRASWKHI